VSPSARLLALGAACSLVACELGQIITLGTSTASGGAATAVGGAGGMSGGGPSTGAGPALGGNGPGGAPPILGIASSEVVAGLSSPEKDDNPTLSADELLLCFTSLRPGATGESDIWCAERSSSSDAFGEPSPVDVANQEGFEASPALELDGLALWFGSDREDSLGGSDIFVVTRALRTDPWGEAVRVDELCSGEDDIPRPPAMGNTVMPLASRRGDDASYWTYFAVRSSPSAAFGPPELLSELATPEESVVDGFLTEDGLMFLFTLAISGGEVDEDIYVAVRPDLQSPFTTPTEVGGLNGDANDRDPWLSPDRRRLYFSSDRSGEFEIYVALVE